MGIGPKEILIILVIALLLFGGGGKISQLMGDFAKGIKAFKKGLQEDDKSLEDRSGKTAEVAEVPKSRDQVR
jgi:sec-independent protein translocase protein TatA